MTVQSVPQKRPPHRFGFYRCLVETGKDWVADNAMKLSAALSLYCILSLAPLLVITFKIVEVLWRDKAGARDQVTHQLTNLMGSQGAGAVQPMLDNGARGGHGIVAAVISAAVLIFSATGVFMELQDSMNIIWRVRAAPNQGVAGFIRNRLLSVAMVFGIAFLLLVSMFISSLLTALAKHLAGDARAFAFVSDAAVSLFVVWLLFSAIFKFLPDATVRWRDVWLGALMTAVLFTVGKYGLALYFKFASPTSAFGAAGSLAAVLLWVYYSSFILFFGAEFTKVWARQEGHPIEPQPGARRRESSDA